MRATTLRPLETSYASTQLSLLAWRDEWHVRSVDVLLDHVFSTGLHGTKLESRCDA